MKFTHSTPFGAARNATLQCRERPAGLEPASADDWLEFLTAGLSMTEGEFEPDVPEGGRPPAAEQPPRGRFDS